MRIKYLFTTLILLLLMLFSLNGQTNRLKYKYDANTSEVILNIETTEIVEDINLTNGKRISLKKGVLPAINGERNEPDITIKLNSLFDGHYVLSSFAVANDEGTAYFNKTLTKFESLYLRIQFDDDLPINRVVAVPWNRPLQTLCNVNLTKSARRMKIWLPRGINLEYLEFNTYIPPKVPNLFDSYIPEYFTPKSHPRLWITKEQLPLLRSQLVENENLEIWNALKDRALIPFSFTPDPLKEFKNDVELEKACREKAFYYLMTGNENIAKEVVSLINYYLPFVQFDNLLDVTRSIGATIYTSSLVYDWCYNFLTDTQKKVWINAMLRLAEDMEIGWPPFKQSIVNAHGNEAQLSRDLLSMAIAVADEFPEAYSYCSFIVTKQLVPMKNFEYQSPRHPQGVNYGAYRIGWDLHAALFYKKMIGVEIFDSNIKDIFKYWTYMRTPSGEMLRDGDGFGAPKIGEKNYYWKNPFTMFLAYAYTGNSFFKSEFLKQGGANKIDPYLFLLLNHPDLKPNENHNYPLTIDFGDITGSMIARTGWSNNDDVVVEMRGGGVRNGAHQHSDAGAIQLYYRGFQFGDIGMYLFASTPYDINFNRRSVAHSMMLVHDPNEIFGENLINDGGQKYNRPFPKTPDEAISDSIFKNGEVISGSFGPSSYSPTFSYFSVDLASAYSNKISDYVRSFCFINTKRNDVPGIIILSDNLTTTNNDFKKNWQINSHNTPTLSTDGIILENRVTNTSPIGKTHVNFLLPQTSDRNIKILKDKEVFTIDGVYFNPPATNLAERTAKRTLVSTNTSNKRNRFLTVLQVTDGDASPFPFEYFEGKESYVIIVDNKVVVMSNSSSLIDNNFKIIIPKDKKYQLAVMGLKKGVWKLKNKDNAVLYSQNVEIRNNSIFIETIASGEYSIVHDNTVVK